MHMNSSIKWPYKDLFFSPQLCLIFFAPTMRWQHIYNARCKNVVSRCEEEES
jgi:hypothetical protein